MNIALTKTNSQQHPLIVYMKNWEAFNNVDRRATRMMLVKIFACCVAVIVGAQFLFTGWS